MKICGSSSGVEYLPLPQDDPKQRKPDISRAQQLLDWNPTIPLREGLKKTVADFKQRVANSKQQTADSQTAKMVSRLFHLSFYISFVISHLR